MPVLFKNIRRFLLKQNRVKSYLLYAIGEIVLVVIGILIALQVNNWNENRKTKIEEKKLLNQLEIDFQDNQHQLTDRITEHQSIDGSLRKLLTAIRPDPKKIPEDSLNKYISDISHMVFYKPNTATITTLISSGKISIISNDSLALLLSKWPEKLESYQFGTTIIYNLYQNQILPYTVEQLHFRNSMIDVGLGNTGPSRFSTNQENILSDPILENLAELRRVNEELLQLIAIDLKTHQAKILRLIKKQLSKN